MSIIDTITLSYQKIIGQFLQVKPILYDLKKEATIKKEYSKFLPIIEKLLTEYEPVFNDLNKLLSEYSKVKEGKFSITTLVPSFISFSSKANYFIQKTSDLEKAIKGNSKLIPISIIPSYLYFITGLGLGLWLRKQK